jgi:acetyl esterase/lipase
VHVDRRTLLGGLGGLGGLGALGLLAACGEDQPVTPAAEPGRRIAYGDGPEQYAELYRPEGESRGVVVVLHGGFWKAAYDASLGRPLADSLADRGWTAWNLEYRRVGNGGGAPETFDDVAAGIDALADVEDLDLSTVIALGHSAGGHLAVWAASRGRFERWQPERVPLSGVISQAGVMDLRTAHRDVLGGGAVEALLGHPPGPADDRYDPIRQIPLDVPVWCEHGSADDTVPISQSREYVTAAKAAGAEAGLVEFDGDHYVVIEPGSEVWARQLELLGQMA